MRAGLFATALVLSGCAAERGPMFATIVEPPVASLTGIAPRDVTRVAMSNNNCPQPYEDGEGGVIVTSCGRMSIANTCMLKGDDARFVAGAMRGVVTGPAEPGLGRNFAVFIQLSDGRVFSAAIPAEPRGGSDRVAIRAGGSTGTISAADLVRLQAIARRTGCLNPSVLDGGAR